MALGKRERVLAALAGGLLLAFVGWLLVAEVYSRLEARRAQIDQRAGAVEKKATRFRSIQKAQARLTEWNRRALPSDVEAGRLLYENWLLELVDRAKFQRKRVESGEIRPHRGGLFTVLSFTVRGQAKLAELTHFLHDFYTTGHLHQVRRLTIKPLENSPDFDFSATIEAISLPTADRRDKLSNQTLRLAGADLAEYQKVIVGRNLFAPYAPPKVDPSEVAKKPEPATPIFDHAKYVYVTGITRADGKPQAWLKSRTTDKQFLLAEGEQFQVGAIQGKVTRIGDKEVEIELDGKRRVVPLGDNIRDGGSTPRL